MSPLPETTSESSSVGVLLVIPMGRKCNAIASRGGPTVLFEIYELPEDRLYNHYYNYDLMSWK